MLIITMLFIYGSGGQQVNNNEKILVNRWQFHNCHADVAVQRGAHRPMEHIPGFNRSRWMPPSGECSHRIAAAAAVVDNFG